MFRDVPWAPARGSFGTPVLPPTVDPDASPTKSFDINCQWLPYIRGALLQLVLQATWETDDPAVLLLAQQRAMLLISMFEECSSLSVPFACFGNLEESSAPFGTWSIHQGGTWVSGEGYQATCCFVSDVSHYNLIGFQIAFDAPVLIDNIELIYNLERGELDVSGDVSGIHIQDVTNGGNIGTPVTLGGLVDGTGQSYNTGPHTPATSVISIVMTAGEKDGGSPVPPGTVNLIEVNIAGSSTNPPC